MHWSKGPNAEAVRKSISIGRKGKGTGPCSNRAVGLQRAWDNKTEEERATHAEATSQGIRKLLTTPEAMQERAQNLIAHNSLRPNATGKYDANWNRGAVEGTCQICGKKKSNIRHHLDYDKSSMNLANIVLLCRSCHTRGHRLGVWPIDLNTRTLGVLS